MAKDSNELALDLLGTAMGLPAQVRQMSRGKPASDAMVNKKLAYEDAMNQIATIANRKVKGFEGKGVNTGPIISFLPNNVSSKIAELQGLPVKSQSDRANLEQDLLYFTNPTRSAITGASAAVEEIKNYIAPMLPGLSDDDSNFVNKLFNSAEKLGKQYQNFYTTMKVMGYDVGDMQDPGVWMDGLRTTLYPPEAPK